MADMGLEERWKALGDAVDAWLDRGMPDDKLAANTDYDMAPDQDLRRIILPPLTRTRLGPLRGSRP